MRCSSPPTLCAGKLRASSRTYLDSLVHTEPVLMTPVSQQGSPPCRIFEQEWSDACLALRGRSNPHTSTQPCCQHPRTVGPEGEGAGVGAGRRKGEQDAKQKGRAEGFQDANHVLAHPAVSMVIWFSSCTFILPPSPHQHTPKNRLCLGSQHSCAPDAVEGVRPAAVPLNRSVIFSACLARAHLKSSTFGFPVAYEYVELVKWARLPWVEFKVTAISTKKDMGSIENWSKPRNLE